MKIIPLKIYFILTIERVLQTCLGFRWSRLLKTARVMSERDLWEVLRQRKMKMKKRMEVVLGGQGGGDDDTKDDENNDGKIKCMVDVTSGKLVFEP